MHQVCWLKQPQPHRFLTSYKRINSPSSRLSTFFLTMQISSRKQPSFLGLTLASFNSIFRAKMMRCPSPQGLALRLQRTNQVLNPSHQTRQPWVNEVWAHALVSKYILAVTLATRATATRKSFLVVHICGVGGLGITTISSPRPLTGYEFRWIIILRLGCHMAGVPYGFFFQQYLTAKSVILHC